MKRPGTLGPCDSCQSEVYLYPRGRALVCRGCAELGQAPGRFKTATRMPHYVEVNLRDNPISQPQVLASHGNGNCVHCSASCAPTYAWQDTVAYACGWGHAGFWMDAQIAELEARQSLLGET